MSHVFSTQSVCSVAFPLHNSPLFFGGGSSHCLERDFIPNPQLSLHSDQDDQRPQWPLTAAKWELNFKSYLNYCKGIAKRTNIFVQRPFAFVFSRRWCWSLMELVVGALNLLLLLLLFSFIFGVIVHNCWMRLNMILRIILTEVNVSASADNIDQGLDNSWHYE